MGYGAYQAGSLQYQSWQINRRQQQFADANPAYAAPGATPNVFAELGRAGAQGLGDADILLANVFTFGMIPSLDARAKQLEEENPTYIASEISFIVAREALITAATMGAGTILRGSAAGVEYSCWAIRGARAVQAANAARDLWGVGSGSYNAYQAYQAGDTGGVVANTLTAALSAFGFASSAKSLAGAYRSTGNSQGFFTWLFSKACFAAGTPLLTPAGSKPIEQFKPGDLVLARSEWDADGPVEPKAIEELFVRTSPILHLHVGGRVIRTSSEHPFWADGRGWVSAGDLQRGDILIGHDGGQQAVEEAYDTGEWETVYNCRVRDFSTYFVGGEDWGFSVWAHNAPCNLNNNGAKSTFGVYEISINGALHKVGKADMGRVTQSTGLPTRLHQQLRKLGEIFGRENVSHTLTPLGNVTSAQAKLAETARLQQIFDQTGFILIGNWKSFRPRLS
jgi:hypothetical protein